MNHPARLFPPTLLMACLAAFLVLRAPAAHAQASFGFSSFTQYCGDTVEYSEHYFGEAQLKNYGNTTFNGPLLLLYSVNGLVSDDTLFSINLHNFHPGDYITNVPVNMHVSAFENFGFGDNIVVIWPVALGNPVHDSLKRHVVVRDPLGISTPTSAAGISVWNSHARLHLIYHDPSLETSQLSITDLSGRALLVSEESNPAELPVDNLPEGIYLLLVKTKDGQRYVFRFIK